MKILVIEDEDQLREQLKEQLHNSGYVVDAVPNGEEGLYQGDEYPYDLAIVDIGLPGISGIEVIRKWRAHGKNIPVLILTARGRWEEKVEGLEAGADDYMVKPFSIEELQARVRALIRRSGGWSDSSLRCGPVLLDMVQQSVMVDDRDIDLTAYEYRVLEYMMLHAGEVISKTHLTEHIYEQDFDRDSNVIEVFVGRLRKKLDPGNDFKPIETLRGRGYRFAIAREELT
jgi:two-component system response regulator PhoP